MESPSRKSRRRSAALVVKSPSSVSGGGASGGAPKAKRARRHLLMNDDRRPPTSKSTNDQISTRSTCSPGRATPARSTGSGPVLPVDLLTSSLLYLDVGDVPSTSAVCKDWRAALQAVEDELWLGLVRRHCPSVEEITNLTELSPTKKKKKKAMLAGAGYSGGDSGSIAVTGCGSGRSSSGIPAPSKSWRRQFQRHVLLNRSDSDSTAPEKPPPKTLSAYFFKVDLILFQKKEGATGKGDQVGIVSRVFPDVKFKTTESAESTQRITFTFDGMHEDMKKHTFSTFDLRVTVFEKATGRQALLHCSGIEDLWDVNVWCSDYYPLKCAYLLDNLVTPDDQIQSMLWVYKSGCVSSCDHDGWDFYDVPGCDHCNCDVTWSCFWDMEIHLRIAAFFDWDSVELDEAQLLRFLEEHIEFK